MTNKFAFKDEFAQLNGLAHTGKNFILDRGLPLFFYREYVKSLYRYIDCIKLGGTTWSLLDNVDFMLKLDFANNCQIPICLGGTLFEIAYAQGAYRGLLDFLSSHHIPYIEIASGFAVAKTKVSSAIKQAIFQGLTVIVEIGHQDSQLEAHCSFKAKIMEISEALESGASYVIVEAGSKFPDNSIYSTNTIDNLRFVDHLASKFGLEKIIFKTPDLDAQIKLINNVGSSVNIGNIDFDDLFSLETIRRRIHADTYGKKCEYQF